MGKQFIIVLFGIFFLTFFLSSHFAFKSVVYPVHAKETKNIDTQGIRISERYSKIHSLSYDIDWMISEILEDINKQQKKRIAVSHFVSLEDRFAAFKVYLFKELHTGLAKSNKVSIVEEQLFEKVLSELQIKENDLIGGGYTQEFGKLTGADSVLVGEVSFSNPRFRVEMELIDTVTGKTDHVINIYFEGVLDEQLKKLLGKEIESNSPAYLGNNNMNIQKSMPNSTVKQKKETSLVWPSPPDKPRIEYLYSVLSSDDVNEETFGRKLKETFIRKASASSFGKPYAVHADREGRILVTDSAWGKVLVFDRKHHKFSIIGESGAGILSKPLGVTTDSKNNLYVTDSVKNRIIVYDRDGNFIKAMGKEGDFKQPVGIALNESVGQIYVVDTQRHNVQVLNMEGEVIQSIGQPGTMDGEFNFPTNIAVDKNGKVYVTDSYNFRVQIFDKDGNFLRKFGGLGTGLGMFSKPKGISVDSEGHIYVVDAAFNNVQIFDKEGRLLLVFGEMGTKPGQFWLPAGIYIDEKDNIYIADQYNRRISVYRYLGENPKS